MVLNVAAVSATTGAVDLAVAPLVGTTTTDRVTALAAGPSLVYAGGYFTTVNGLTRTHLAAFHTDGTLDTAWAPRANKRVFSMKMDCTGSTLFVGGQFQRASNNLGPLRRDGYDREVRPRQRHAPALGRPARHDHREPQAPTPWRPRAHACSWPPGKTGVGVRSGQRQHRQRGVAPGTNGNVQAIAYTGGERCDRKALHLRDSQHPAVP